MPQQTVFVDMGDGYFQPRRVETGWRMDNPVEIVKGLMPGERIVISGNLLIDSESRLQGLSSTFRSSDAIDSVCGMRLDPSRAGNLKSVVKGETFFFCSTLCRDKFDKNPGQYPSADAHHRDHQQVGLALRQAPATLRRDSPRLCPVNARANSGYCTGAVLLVVHYS